MSGGHFDYQNDSLCEMITGEHNGRGIRWQASRLAPFRRGFSCCALTFLRYAVKIYAEVILCRKCR